jgi:hypothetical protein
MKGILRKSLWIVATCALSTTAFSIDLSGKWTGKMVLDGSALVSQLKSQSQAATGNKKKQIESRLKTITESIQFVSKTKIRLELKKGGAAFIEFTRNDKPEPEWCKWVVSNKRIQLTGFSGGGDSTMVLDGIVAEENKKLIFDMSFVIAKQMDAQGLKSKSKPKMTLTFTKT